MNDKKSNTGAQILLVLLVALVLVFILAPGYLFNGQLGYYRSHLNLIVSDLMKSLQTPLNSIAQSVTGFFSSFKLR